MIVPLLLYNVLLVGLDAMALAQLRRAKTTSNWLKVCMAVAAVAATLALALGTALVGSRFAVLHLAAYGIFLHGPLLLVGSAVVLWPARRTTAIGSALLALIVVGVGVHAFLIEPTSLEVSHVELKSEKVTRRVRIVVLADLQTDRFGEYERKVFRRVLEEEPDLILLAGDYFQADGPTVRRLRGEMKPFLAEIGFTAPDGVFAVRGNIDPPDWAETFEGLPIQPVEASQSFELDRLRVTCLSYASSFNPALKLEQDETDKFQLVVGHGPLYAMGDVQGDLLIAGHTHGGQVRLPGIGPVITLSGPLPRRWADGMTDLPQGGKLYVSRGIGMERGSAPRLRFLCRPELVVIDVVPR